MSGNSLLSPEARDCIAQCRNYLENTVFEIQIIDTEQRACAVALGNEIQKRYSTIEKQRKAEKSVWDEKARSVQAEFRPILDLLAEKKALLARSITTYDREREQARIAAQAEADRRADAVREKLEAAAGTAKERALALLNEANRLLEEAAGLPAEERTTLDRQAKRLLARAAVWNAKAGVKSEQAAAVVPEIVPETPQRVSGERKKKEFIVTVTDIYDFLKYCIEQRCAETYLLINEARLKKTEGAIQFPGIIITEKISMTFTGR